MHFTNSIEYIYSTISKKVTKEVNELTKGDSKKMTIETLVSDKTLLNRVRNNKRDPQKNPYLVNDTLIVEIGMGLKTKAQVLWGSNGEEKGKNNEQINWSTLFEKLIEDINNCDKNCCKKLQNEISRMFLIYAPFAQYVANREISSLEEDHSYSEMKREALDWILYFDRKAKFTPYSYEDISLFSLQGRLRKAFYNVFVDSQNQSTMKKFDDRFEKFVLEDFSKLLSEYIDGSSNYGFLVYNLQKEVKKVEEEIIKLDRNINPNITYTTNGENKREVDEAFSRETIEYIKKLIELQKSYGNYDFKKTILYEDFNDFSLDEDFYSCIEQWEKEQAQEYEKKMDLKKGKEVREMERKRRSKNKKQNKRRKKVEK